MNAHLTLLWIFLICALLISVIFLFLFLSSASAPPDSLGMKNPKRKRLFLSALLGALLVILLSATLPRSPYYLHAGQVPASVVHVQAAQYSFNLSHTGETSYDELELPLGGLIEFRVTSKDVNHGFGIYNGRKELIAQVQAMPGYVNRLRWVFDEPGKYHILCLEYCGMSHHAMHSSFTVK